MSATKTKTEIVELTGTVSTLYCQRPTFCAGKINTTRSFGLGFTIKGYVKTGQTLRMRGRYVQHAKYGRQFEADEIVYDMPETTEGLVQWLHWNISGIGPATAQKLVDEFGKDLMPLIASDPGQVAAQCGLPITAVEAIARLWQQHSSRIAVQSKLAGFGLTQHQVEKIVEKFGGTAATVIEENPYLLLGEVDGLGFARIDEIALKCGVPRKDERRTTAALQWTLRGGYYDEGHTAMLKEVAIAKVEELLGEDAAHAGGAAALLETQGRLVHVSEPGSGGEAPVHYCTPHAHRIETRLWKYFARGREENEYFDRLGLPADSDQWKAITVKANGQEVTLDETQSAAVLTACRYRVSVITGGAGAGKTLVARAIAKMFTGEQVPVVLVAPTGKAARRLREVVGMDAATIHRTLGYNPDGGFTHNEDNPLPAAVYIVDEVSMVDAELMASLVRALPEPVEDDHSGSALILIGDENQLPPVGAGAVLRDLIAHDLVPAARLTKCHRQAGTLKINATAILDGRVELTDVENDPPAWVVHKGLRDADRVVAAVKSLYATHLQKWGYDAVTQTQFMTAKHAGKLGTKYLNKLLQWLHQKTLGVELDEPVEQDDRRPALYIGDKVIHTRNNYQLNVMNGTVGIVESTSPLVVAYDDQTIEYPDDCKGQVDLAYCLTPHKMQGSEVPCAVVVCAKANSFMQTRNWLYTGCTRARKTCVIIGDDESIRRAAERTDANKRTTLLQVYASQPGTRPENPNGGLR